MTPTRSAAPPAEVWPLARLARELSLRLEEDWPLLWVAGEISGHKVHTASGHHYFTLKDSQAQFSAVMWRSRAEQAGQRPADGLRVEAQVRLVFYAPRGQLQLEVQRLRAAGRGDLMLALQELKERLAAEGLFDPARRRPLPAYPRRVGLLTAEGGAALQDLLQVFRRRWPALRCYLLPVPVQGPQAGPALAAGLRRLSAWPGLDLDLVILGRGGGSFEDLFGFNDEGLVRAIAACPVPVVSAVGHEIDTTLSDLAADLRAPTPSAAAELAVPDAAATEGRLAVLGGRLRSAMAARQVAARLRLDSLATHRALAEPRRRLATVRQRLDELAERLPAGLARLGERAREREARLARSLRAAIARQQAEASSRLLGWPRRLTALAGRSRRDATARLAERRETLERAVRLGMERRRERLGVLAERLARLETGRFRSRVLRMGFVLPWRESGRLVAGARSLAPGDRLRLEFHDGNAGARVDEVKENPA